VASSLGVVLGVYPYLTAAGLLAFGVWLLVTGVTRYVSAGSVAAAVALTPLLAGVLAWRRPGFLHTHWPLLAFSALASALVIYRHRENIARLRAGTEHRLGQRRSPHPAPDSAAPTQRTPTG
jgi:glycerol-3-phosphate acyltransferase PlsY